MIWLFTFLIIFNTTIFCGTKLNKKILYHRINAQRRMNSLKRMRRLSQTIKQDPEKANAKKARDYGLKRASQLLHENIIDQNTYQKIIAALPVVSFKKKSTPSDIPTTIDISDIILTENKDGVLIPHILLGRFSRKDDKTQYHLPKIKREIKKKLQKSAQKRQLIQQIPDQTDTRSSSPLSMISDSGYQEED